MRKLIDYSESEIDKINAIVSNVDDFELEEIKEGNSSIVREKNIPVLVL